MSTKPRLLLILLAGLCFGAAGAAWLKSQTPHGPAAAVSPKP